MRRVVKAQFSAKKIRLGLKKEEKMFFASSFDFYHFSSEKESSIQRRGNLTHFDRTSCCFCYKLQAHHCLFILGQACQTQTISRAAKALKTAWRGAKALKSTLNWPYYTTLGDICFIMIILVLKIMLIIQYYVKNRWNVQNEKSYSGRTKEAKGPHAARGPPVWHACSRGMRAPAKQFTIS